MPENLSTARSILFKLALIVLPFLGFLVLAEIGLRLYLSSNIFYDVEMARYANELKQESDNPLIGHVHRPSRSLHVMGVGVDINSDGFRDDEYTHARNEKKRYILLGDSLTLGWGVEKKESFEHRLEQKFNETKPTELINFGTGNYNTTQEVNLFMEKGLRSRPDGVFLFYFINDAEPVPVKSRHAWLARFRLVTFFWSRIKALEAIRTPGEGFREYYAKLYQKDQPGWLQTRAALLELKKVCAENGIALKVVILPELHNLAAYPFMAEHALLTAYLSKHMIEHIDLAPHFAGETDPSSMWVARDDAHPNVKAHRLIAEASFPFLSGLSNQK
jgi:lysophospholipase L1-like esterase